MHLEDATGELDATLVGKHGSEFFRVPPPPPLPEPHHPIPSLHAASLREVCAGVLQGSLPEETTA